MVEMAREEFERLVSLALDEVPPELAREMSNVVVLVEDDPPDGQTGLLGLYEGTPLTERGEWWAAGSLPDRIYVFRRAILGYCRTPEEVAEQVRITVLHEIGHHFGIGDERLHELGWA